MAHNHLKGLNTLRFFAAILVLIDHGRHHLNEMNISFAERISVFHQGKVAVDFFFVLSGFLISYLALNEIKKTGKINYKFFYVRRILRIMPLYYLVLFLSLFLIGFIVPILLNEDRLGFPLIEGGLLFIFMLPNLVKPIWESTVGGINILWSIGVEEQFYLLFPLIMFCVGRVKRKILIAGILFLSYYIFYWSIQYSVINVSDVLVKFIATLKFHYMLIGILFSLICHTFLNDGNKINLFQKLIDNDFFQSIIFVLALVKIFIAPTITPILNDVFTGLIFSMLVIVVSHRNKGKIFNFDFKLLSYLGLISYGIYLLHPLVSYFIRFIITKSNFVGEVVKLYPYTYVIALILVTLLVANFSYRFFEIKFLNLKDRFR